MRARWGSRALLLLLLLLGACPRPAQAGGGGGYGLSGITLLAETGDPVLDRAQRIALSVLGADFTGVTHVAARDYYGNPWVRDSYAWGMIPSLRGAGVSAYATSELQYWLDRQQRFGGWLTAPKSGYFDETPMLIGAVLDAYRITGDYRMLRRAVPQLERGWGWLARGYIRPSAGSKVLLYATVPPHVAADWADQVGRHGYATQLEALWYWGTRSLGIMELLTDHSSRGRYYLRYAARIRDDINRLLWTKGAPYVFNQAPVAPFGHYRSWAGGHDYFELDSNFLCIVYGISNPGRTASIDAFVARHASYLLGVGGTGVPARVVYGDYAPRDYAWKHNSIGPDRYQSAAWPTVGALVARGLARSGYIGLARQMLLRLGTVFVRDSEIWEWYSSDGQGHGGRAFGWAARMFVLALYDAYLGVQADDSLRNRHLPTGLHLRVPAGNGEANVTFQGRSLVIVVAGTGRRVRASIGGRPIRGAVVPGYQLCGGCTLVVHWRN